MPYKRFSGDLQEQEAFEHHAKVYGKHTFNIHNIQEYVKMRPFINMCGGTNRRNVTLIVCRELRGIVLWKEVRKVFHKKDNRESNRKYREKQRLDSYVWSSIS